ncbi:hypothetical protein N2152v2_001297 [Parachlorella kessleri]
MDANRAANAAKGNRNLLIGLGVALVGGYYFYSRSGAQNLGDAASRAGTAAGQKLESAGRQVGGSTGEHMKEEGRGLQKFHALIQCQNDHPIANLWGACHDQLQSLVSCCRNEKKTKRTANVEKAKQDRERLMEKIKRRKEKEGGTAAIYAPGYGVGGAVSEQMQ